MTSSNEHSEGPVARAIEGYTLRRDQIGKLLSQFAAFFQSRCKTKMSPAIYNLAMPNIFISYSSKDRDFVTRLAQDLIARVPDIQVWYDMLIPPGSSWAETLSDQIEKARKGGCYPGSSLARLPGVRVGEPGVERCAPSPSSTPFAPETEMLYRHAPVEQVMYLDKIIIAHSLLQAIARRGL